MAALSGTRSLNGTDSKVKKPENMRRSKSADPILCGNTKPIQECTRQELLSASDSLPQESVVLYAEGGFMHVKIGQIIGGYKVVRKMGHGSNSTVWMAAHIFRRRQYVAMKIAKATKSSYENMRKEVAIMKSIRKKNREHPGYNFVMKICFELDVKDLQATHRVLVMETVGKSLYDLILEATDRGINVDAARSIIKQIMLGLTYIHGECKMIHTDLKPANIIVKSSERFLSDIEQKVKRLQSLGEPLPNSYITTIEYLEKKYETLPEPPASNITYMRRPATTDARLNAGKDRNTIYGPMLVSPTIEVKIADFGNVIQRQPVNVGIIQTPLYRSLEVYLAEQFDYSADIWSLGCIIFELMTGKFLFSTNRPNQTDAEQIMLIYQILKGEIPRHMCRNGKHVIKYFTPDGVLRGRHMITHMDSPKEILINYLNWPEAQAEKFGDLVAKCITADPMKRPTAEDLLDHDWLKDTDWI